MMPGIAKGGKSGLRQTGFAAHTSTAAESSFTTVNASLPGGATGRPIKLKASGSIAGLVQIQFGNQASYTLQVAPNQLPVEYEIPQTAFPNDVNSVPILFECVGGVGTLTAVVEFEVKR